jgi:hypothetical protein
MTTWWFDDEVCWIAECESCGVPMVVWKSHSADPPPAVREYLLKRLQDVAGVHGPTPFWIDETLRTIPDHYHAHARRRPWA